MCQLSSPTKRLWTGPVDSKLLYFEDQRQSLASTHWGPGEQRHWRDGKCEAVQRQSLMGRTREHQVTSAFWWNWGQGTWPVIKCRLDPWCSYYPQDSFSSKSHCLSVIWLAFKHFNNLIYIALLKQDKTNSIQNCSLYSLKDENVTWNMMVWYNHSFKKYTTLFLKNVL